MAHLYTCPKPRTVPYETAGNTKPPKPKQILEILEKKKKKTKNINKSPNSEK